MKHASQSNFDSLPTDRQTHSRIMVGRGQANLIVRGFTLSKTKSSQR